MKSLGLNRLWVAIVTQAQVDWHVSPRAVALLLAAPFIGAAWLLHLRKTGRDLAWRPFLLPAFLISPFIIVLIMRFARLTVLKSSVPAGFDEFEEAVLAVGVASFCLLAWRFQSASQRRL